MTAHRTDNSVMFALEELRTLESDRLAQEERERRAAQDAQREARLRAQREARAQEEQEAEHARRVAEAEARLRVEQDLRSRDVEAERRMATLRAELDAVVADRERIHATVSRLGEEVDTAARRPRGWIVAFGASALLAAGLAFVLVSRPPVTEQPIAQVPVSVSDPAAAQGAEAGEPEGSDPVAEPVPDAPDPAETPPAEPASVATAPAEGRTGVRPHGSTRTTDADRPGMHGADSMDTALDFDHCGSDPTCGLDLDP